MDIDRIARAIDPAKLGPRGIAQLLETLDLLARADSDVHLSDVRTPTLVRLIARASDAQLDAVAASDAARGLVLAEVFDRMSGHLRARRANRTSAVVHWRIGCQQAKADAHEWFQTVIDGGACTTGTELDRAPRVTLTVNVADFLRLATGITGPVRLFATRRLRIRGDVRYAIRLAGLFEIPAA